jgi:fructokinase
MPDVICLGELLIDFVAQQSDTGLDRAQSFAKAAGGAPANVAVAVSRLERSSGFIGAVGRDPFGDFLAETLAADHVDLSQLARIEDARTTLAFIAAHSDGRKDITFWRNPGADQHLAPEHVDADYLRAAAALHYGSISRIDEPPRQATDRARELAADGGLLISYDPNYRPTLWPDRDTARARILEGFDGATLAKISQEEWSFIFGAEDFDTGAEAAFQRGVQIVVRSEGPDGASFATQQARGHAEGFKVKRVEATGAGDAFTGCLIVELLRHWRDGRKPASLSQDELRRIVRRANAVGALACTKVGAIPSLPTTAEVDEMLG